MATSLRRNHRILHGPTAASHQQGSVSAACRSALAGLSFIPHLARHEALRAQVEAVRVAASHRSRGLGAAMFGWAIDEARRRGCALVQLTTDKTCTDAHRFYRTSRLHRIPRGTQTAALTAQHASLLRFHNLSRRARTTRPCHGLGQNRSGQPTRPRARRWSDR
ncbi:MAG: GNAT family N-acetyltransferase [Dermatophilaceae bacterium]